MSETYLRNRQFAKRLKETGGNFKIHTPSGIFEGLDEDAEGIATTLLNTESICFGDYTINPNAIHVIESVKKKKSVKKAE